MACVADEDRSPVNPQRGPRIDARDAADRGAGVDAPSVDEAAYDAYLAALERGAAPGVETLLAGCIGCSGERLTRLARRLGRAPATSLAACVANGPSARSVLRRRHQGRHRRRASYPRSTV